MYRQPALEDLRAGHDRPDRAGIGELSNARRFDLARPLLEDPTALGHLHDLGANHVEFGLEAGTVDLAELDRLVRAGGVKEVILATNPTLEGDGTAMHLHSVLTGEGVTV